MKKICFITTIPITLKSFVLDTAKYLYQTGEFDITFICDNDADFASQLPEYINYIPVSMKRGINLSGISAIYELYKIFREEKFDLVQYSTPNASFYASLAARIVKVPVRLYCQWGIVYVGFLGIKRTIFKFIEKLICRNSTWIEPDSFGNLNFCRSEGLYNEAKGSVIWNGSAAGVNLQKFDINQKEKWNQEIRCQYNIPKDTFVFGFLGRVDKDKGYNELMTAFKLLNDRNVILQMIGMEDKVETVDKELYKWSKISTKVIYTGLVNDPERYYASMDCFVLPSYREGFGTAVIEAEAMGLPVITTNIPGPTDAMSDGITGIIIEKYSVDELYAAMKLILENDEMRDRMSKGNPEYVKQRFEKKQFMEYVYKDRKKLLNIED